MLEGLERLVRGDGDDEEFLVRAPATVTVTESSAGFQSRRISRPSPRRASSSREVFRELVMRRDWRAADRATSGHHPQPRP